MQFWVSKQYSTTTDSNNLLSFQYTRLINFPMYVSLIFSGILSSSNFPRQKKNQLETFIHPSTSIKVNPAYVSYILRCFIPPWFWPVPLSGKVSPTHEWWITASIRVDCRYQTPHGSYLCASTAFTYSLSHRYLPPKTLIPNRREKTDQSTTLNGTDFEKSKRIWPEEVNEKVIQLGHYDLF